MAAPSIFDLEGRTALVTGSTRGLGLAAALALGQAGADIVVNGRSDETIAAAVAELTRKGVRAAGCRFDVTDQDETERAVGSLVAQGRTIDVLVNNAGIQIRKPFLEFSTADWRTILDTHLMGAVAASRAVLPQMVQRQAGKIINICSLQSELGRPTIAPYTAAKGALRMLTRALASEFARHNIQVNGIGPGYFATEMNRNLYEDPEFDAFVRKRTPANRWGRPEELGGSVVFLASAASDFVNGQILYVDGGLLASV